MSGRRRGWPCLLPLAAVLSSVVLFYFVVPSFYPTDPWKIDEEPDWGLPTDASRQKTDISPVSKDDFTIELHPEEHESRAVRAIHVEWNITKGERRPDGVEKEVYLINDQFPGPLLEARSGDELVVNVRNLLKDGEGVAIHWHGIQASNEFDGAAGLTQCTIRPGKELTYRIKIRDDQSGTFWYHSHFETQRADGLYGPLVVHNPATAGNSERNIHGYVDDQVLMIGDWYHRSAVDVLDQYDNWKSFKIEPAPDSILLNGRGFFDCSMAVPARPVDCSRIGLPHMKLPLGRSRLRIVNTGSLTGITLSMTGHYLELIKLDGGNDAQTTTAGTEIGILYPGERMDLIADNIDPSSEGGRITVALDQENIRYANQALRPVQQFPISPASKRKANHAPFSRQDSRVRKPFINVAQSQGNNLSRGEMPRETDKTFVLYATMSYLAINSNRPKGYINHTTWTVAERYTPLLALDRVRWPSEPAPLIPTTEDAEWIDIVLNNMDDKGHPFHLHGHDFYVLSRHAPARVGSYDLWNPFDSTKSPAGGPMNLVNPAKKDTVYVPSMGYVVLRFHANNPGLWLLHCHILWHQSVGMGMAFQVGDYSSKDTWLALRNAAQDSCRG